jgi:hypothetical protein
MKDYELEKIAQNLVDNVQDLTADNAYKWLMDNEWRIYSHHEKKCHKEDILTEIEDRNQTYKDDCEEQGILPDCNKLLKINDNDLDCILERYEDKLCDSEEWHSILDNVVDDFYDDMEMGMFDDDD